MSQENGHPGDTGRDDGAPDALESTREAQGDSRFGVFKNQGDCVSFVATKGKNQPAR